MPYNFELTKLSSGDRFELRKEYGLNNIRVELVFEGADLDVQAFLLNSDGLIVNEQAFVYYNSRNRTEPFDKAKHGNKLSYNKMTRPMSADGAVLGSIDQLDGGLEVIDVALDKVSPEVQEIVFTATVYDEGVSFGSVSNAKVSVLNADSDEELCYYELSQQFNNENACILGRLVVNDEGDWEFVADGKAYTGGLSVFVEMFTRE